MILKTEPPLRPGHDQRHALRNVRVIVAPVEGLDQEMVEIPVLQIVDAVTGQRIGGLWPHQFQLVARSLNDGTAGRKCYATAFL